MLGNPWQPPHLSGRWAFDSVGMACGSRHSRKRRMNGGTKKAAPPLRGEEGRDASGQISGLRGHYLCGFAGSLQREARHIRRYASDARRGGAAFCCRRAWRSCAPAGAYSPLASRFVTSKGVAAGPNFYDSFMPGRHWRTSLYSIRFFPEHVKSAPFSNSLGKRYWPAPAPAGPAVVKTALRTSIFSLCR